MNYLNPLKFSIFFRAIWAIISSFFLHFSVKNHIIYILNSSKVLSEGASSTLFLDFGSEFIFMEKI